MYTLTVPTLDLETVYHGPQGLRWRRLRGLNPKRFLVPHGSSCAKIEQHQDRVTVSCVDEKFYDTWFEYLDLSTDYMQVRSKGIQILGEVSNAIMASAGLHLLNMDPWESLVTSAVWYKASPAKVRGLLNELADRTGETRFLRVKEMGPQEWHELPDPSSLMTDLDVAYDVLGRERGKRLERVAEAVYDGSVDPWSWHERGYDAAVRELDGLLDPSSVQRALLWSGFKNALPVTPRVTELATWDYDCNDVDDFVEWHLHPVKGYEGYVSACITWKTMMEIENGNSQRH